MTISVSALVIYISLVLLGVSLLVYYVIYKKRINKQPDNVRKGYDTYDPSTYPQRRKSILSFSSFVRIVIVIAVILYIYQDNEAHSFYSTELSRLEERVHQVEYQNEILNKQLDDYILSDSTNFSSIEVDEVNFNPDDHSVDVSFIFSMKKTPDEGSLEINYCGQKAVAQLQEDGSYLAIVHLDTIPGEEDITLTSTYSINNSAENEDLTELAADLGADIIRIFDEAFLQIEFPSEYYEWGAYSEHLIKYDINGYVGVFSQYDSITVAKAELIIGSLDENDELTELARIPATKSPGRIDFEYKGNLDFNYKVENPYIAFEITDNYGYCYRIDPVFSLSDDTRNQETAGGEYGNGNLHIYDKDNKLIKGVNLYK